MNKLSAYPLAATDWASRNLSMAILDTDEGDDQMLNQSTNNQRGKVPVDITGEKFNLLTAIEPTGRKDNYGRPIWKFKCECGNEVEKQKHDVTRGLIKSCGCLKGKRKADQANGGQVTVLPQTKAMQAVSRKPTAPAKSERKQSSKASAALQRSAPAQTIPVSVKPIPPVVTNGFAPAASVEVLNLISKVIGGAIDACENVSLDHAQQLVGALDSVEVNLPVFLPGADQFKAKIAQYQRAARAFLKFREELEAI